MVNGCEAVRLDSGMDTVLHLNQVDFESLQGARLLVYPRGHVLEPTKCGREPVVTKYLCAIPLLVSIEQRVAVVKCADVPRLDDGRYEGQVQVLVNPVGWLDVGDSVLLESGDVELL